VNEFHHRRLHDGAQTRLDRLIGTRIEAINKLFGTTPRILTPKPKVIS
jgi:hypothetical protein